MKKIFLKVIAIATGVVIAVSANAQDLTSFQAKGKKGLYGYKNTAGEVVIAPKYEFAGSFSEDLSLVREDVNGQTVRSYIDKTGEVKIKLDPDFNEAGNFHNGFAYVCASDQCGYINKQGSLVIPLLFYYAGDFNSQGMAKVLLDFKGSRYEFYINEKAQCVKDCDNIPDSYPKK